MIKRKWLNRDEVKTILEKEVIIKYRNDEFFTGYVSILDLKKVEKTTIVNICGKDRCVLKDGHKWVQWLPKGEKYSVIAIYDENKYLTEWYVDILKNQGTEENGMPYYDDLFLDVVIFRDGSMILLDEDELLEALNNKEITREEYDLAYEEGKKILNRFRDNIDKEVKYTEEMVSYIEK
ncbi:DUF402 domain-containing protein [Clostridium massiliamazoniense]|uniref:DUF402 domain-containing protein n=1 Tax=Clostridium massiliamazoniense TaxID=1347366 RepID=UPI0006D7B9C9|nr:DUF402 domain-containing protein [Clostridium massiliamazoniense]